MRYEVLVEVRLRPGIADPQGATIERALPALGFDGVDTIRVGKAIRLALEAPDEDAARARATEMADRLLANPVIEDSVVTVLGAVDAVDVVEAVDAAAVAHGAACNGAR
jgi:phosphoribosylformylglycinamidine synthase PurS subunit